MLAHCAIKTKYLMGLMATQRGVGTISLLSAVGLLSLCLFLLTATALTLRQQEQLQTQCQTFALETQRDQASLLNQLLALNPQALRLREKRKLANRNLRLALASAHPKAIAIARGHWSFVKAQQLKLQSKQLAILKNSRTELRLARQKIRYQLQKQKVQVSHWQAPDQLSVKTKGMSSGSPTYHPTRHIQSRQRIEIEWQTQLPKEASRWISPLRQKAITMQKRCAATLKGQEIHWQARLTKAKSPQRFSLR